MDSTFQQFVIMRNSHYLTEYLDNYTASLNPDLLNRWFHQAARLPGNYEDDRNVWLQGYYEKYVPAEIRQGVKLTDKQLFPCIPNIKIPPTPAKNQQRQSRLLPAIRQATGRMYRGSEEINIIQQD